MGHRRRTCDKRSAPEQNGDRKTRLKKVGGMDASSGRLWFALPFASPIGRFGSAMKRLLSAVTPVTPLAAIALLCVANAASAVAADYRTQNFLVMAPDAGLARAVGDAAEAYRRDLAIYWLGGELPPWPTPCPIRVISGPNLAAQGVTTYNRAPVRDFQMEVVGSPQRILDSVLPHEVTHTILATYFGRPLPRWADEGICTTVEHVSERQKHEAKLLEFLRSRRGIAMNKLFLLTEYPQDVLPMYAQGYSVCQFLIAQNGARQFVGFLGDYMQNPSWTHTIRKHYGYESLAELQQAWLAWVSDGSGPVDAYVKNAPRPASPADGVIPASLTLASAGPAATPLTINQVAQASATSDQSWYSRLRPGQTGGKASGQAVATATAPNAHPPSLGPATPISTATLAKTAPSPQTAAPSGMAGANVPVNSGGISGDQGVGNRFRPIPPGNPTTLHSVAQPQPEQGMSPAGESRPMADPYQDVRGYRPGSLAEGGSYYR
jgi:hypothetical protein